MSNAFASGSNGHLLAAADFGCIAFSNNAIHSAGADGAACESIDRFIDLVVDSLFKVCTCVAVDGAEDSGEYVRCRCESGTSFKAAPTSADGPLTDVDCEVVHALEGQFKLVLGKAFCMQEPVTWSDELGNFVILQAARR